MSRSQAPLDRSILDIGRPFLRFMLGLLFVGFSATSTVRLATYDLATYFKLGNSITLYLVNDGIYVAIALAFILFVGELMTASYAPRIYMVFLGIDTFYTARGIFPGLYNVFSAAMGASTEGIVASTALAIVASIVVGVYVAYYGEILLFGPRKAARGKAE